MRERRVRREVVVRRAIRVGREIAIWSGEGLVHCGLSSGALGVSVRGMVVDLMCSMFSDVLSDRPMRQQNDRRLLVSM